MRRLTVAAIALGFVPQTAGAPVFMVVQPELFAAGASFVNAWADFDGDGALDLFVGFNGEPNRLYRNTPGGFVDVAVTAGVADARPARAAAWGDFNADGDMDLLVGFAPGAGSVLRLYRNARGRFTDVTDAVGLAVPGGAVRQTAWVDFDDDDDLDLFVAFRDRANALYVNDGGRFRDVAAERGLADTRRTVGAAWFDADEDGDLDVVVANMDSDANGLFINSGGRFTDVWVQDTLRWGGRRPGDATNGSVRPCPADVNNDGRFDLFFANYGYNGLFLSQGAGRFADASAGWGIAIDARYDACAFADFDNDGRVDLYVNGTVTGGTSYPDYLFRNTGSRFIDVTPANVRALQADHGVQWADFDRDGAVDLALTGVRADGMHYVLRNTVPDSIARRSLSVLVTDPQGRLTRAGAEVRVYLPGTRQLVATQIVDAGSGYNAQSAGPVHLGVGTAARVDVEVIWPSGGRRTSVRVPNVEVSAYRGRSLAIAAPGT